MFEFLFFRKQIKEDSIVFDFSSGSIGIFVVRDGKISHSTRKILDKKETSKITPQIISMLQKEKNFIQKLLGMDCKDLDSYVFMHAPFSKIKPEEFSLSFKKPIKIKPKTLKKLIKCEKGNHYYISKLISKGYQIYPPVNFKTNQLVVKSATYFMQNQEKKFVQDAMAVFGKSLKDSFVFDFAVSVFAIATGTHMKHYTIVDVGEYYTRFVVVKDGDIVLNVSADFGTRKLIELIAKQLNTSISIAKSRLKLYQEGSLLPYWKKKISVIIKDYKSSLLEYWHEHLQIISQEIGLLPPEIFVFTEKSFKPLFVETLSDVSLSGYNIANMPFDVSDIVQPNPNYYSEDVFYQDPRFDFEYYFISKFNKNKHQKHVFITC